MILEIHTFMDLCIEIKYSHLYAIDIKVKSQLQKFSPKNSSAIGKWVPYYFFVAKRLEQNVYPASWC